MAQDQPFETDVIEGFTFRSAATFANLFSPNEPHNWINTQPQYRKRNKQHSRTVQIAEIDDEDHDDYSWLDDSDDELYAPRSKRVHHDPFQAPSQHEQVIRHETRPLRLDIGTHAPSSSTHAPSSSSSASSDADSINYQADDEQAHLLRPSRRQRRHKAPKNKAFKELPDPSVAVSQNFSHRQSSLKPVPSHSDQCRLRLQGRLKSYWRHHLVPHRQHLHAFVAWQILFDQLKATGAKHAELAVNQLPSLPPKKSQVWFGLPSPKTIEITRPLKYSELNSAKTATPATLGMLFGSTAASKQAATTQFQTVAAQRKTIAAKGAATSTVAKEAIGRPARPNYLMLYRR
eukprot:m.29908 g.29908  ORF g.29908 m.29908 type:complete len:346 (+) comp11984_c0_seq2:120-1157(+)